MSQPILARVGGHLVGDGQPLLLIAGPCVMEDEAHGLRHARRVKELAAKHGLPVVFKASFDKANRSSGKSYRGPGLEAGLAAFQAVKRETGLPCLTDVHETWQAEPAGRVVDVLQVPAFLCRQTDLVIACARHGRAVNVKKGQFLAPREMRHAVAKCREGGNENVFLTERGATFGYGNLVVDMRGLVQMRELGVPVCMDATHSVQMPGSGGDTTAGDRQFVAPLARAAAAVGIDALFMEIHEDPAVAKSDGPNSLDFPTADRVLREVLAVRHALGQP
ncbi:2-dehydro-3-deoxyphosphooctonate aldolase [Anaeromyxobacter dehalogenans 2CP-1]|uniref:2-dehydro-3-deoxyphosphooctonate aldolase n=1 Tax=Anaeromyxobacter dehalogenans (strain ATCC BAA-258 / DSM 21875 / 2CP-1) TaxID=455488 RepID=B8JBN5_ANAD2|nr:3-deoxy-8-phosphooctulonate synthase [Anaeromyxobacter dehalogenans]ACL67643.1 2-dehydro-3-deoxyphosphooctonate aldolase [Anaeromyxobacter dehalogenans 2CP-1]